MFHCENILVVDGQGDENSQKGAGEERHILGDHCQQWRKEAVHILGRSLHVKVTMWEEQEEKKREQG